MVNEFGFKMKKDKFASTKGGTLTTKTTKGFNLIGEEIL